MRRLWSDIDNARDNLGLGPEAAASSSAWSVDGVVEYAVALASDTADAVASVITKTVRGVGSLVPDPRRMIASAAPCVRRLPIVGALFD